MTTEKTDEQAVDSAEVARLRAQIAQLEGELASLQAWANGVVADAEKRVYWLDRMHLDLDPIMRRVPFDYALGKYRRFRDRYSSARRGFHRLYGLARRPVDALLRLVRPKS